MAGTKTPFDGILDAARRHLPVLRSLRRHLHAHPELTGSEYATTATLADRMRAIGYQVHLADDDRGAWADVGTASARVLVRGDIDALPIQTRSTTSYRSTVDGVMHACGHDVHATCVFGAALIADELIRNKVLSPADFAVRFVFQPAEEDSTGGLHMIKSGATGGCARSIALHTDPGRPVGTIGVRRGNFTAGCDLFELTLRGRGGHSARPHLTNDALTAMIDLVQTAMVRIPRSTDALSPVVFNVGTLNAGVAPNVVPDTAHATGTLRSVDATGGAAARRTFTRIAESVGEQFGCDVQLRWDNGTPPLSNDDTVVDSIQRVADRLLGPQNVTPITQVSMGAEDFAFIAGEVPGAMFRLGIAATNQTIFVEPSVPGHDDGGGGEGDRSADDRGGGEAGNQSGDRPGFEPLHTPGFDVDERCLAVGAAVLVASAIELSRDSSTAR